MSRATATEWSAPSFKDIRKKRVGEEQLAKIIGILGSFSAKKYSELRKRLTDIFDAYISRREFARQPTSASKHVAMRGLRKSLSKVQKDLDHLEQDDATKRSIMDESEVEIDHSDPYGSRFKSTCKAIDNFKKWVDAAAEKEPKESQPGRNGAAEYWAVFELLRVWKDVNGELPTAAEARSFATSALQPMLPVRAKGDISPLTGHVRRALRELRKLE